MTGGMGYVGATLCLELVRRGAAEVRSFDLRRSSSWASILLDAGVRCIHGTCLVLFSRFSYFKGVCVGSIS